jgi:neurofibromin 1
LFLAAFGGVCIQEDYDPSALNSVVPAQYLPDEMHVSQDPMPMVSVFINDLTDLLIAESAQVREVARDALGNELSPRLFGRFFRHLEELAIAIALCFLSLILIYRITQHVSDGANHELSESFGVFLDQVCDSA